MLRFLIQIYVCIIISVLYIIYIREIDYEDWISKVLDQVLFYGGIQINGIEHLDCTAVELVIPYLWYRYI